ncbi:uncharacterized protein LOC134206795 [Armigeres subalbatus]|uniref:uncharacterized protein LOC134206795 n=1 Tax=Armigeres subalbatus TaxID=124917 RepID=UPI002ED07854
MTCTCTFSSMRAKQAGFAAVAYLRYQEGSNIEYTLLASKTRVSPLKFLSIPRSELQAAVIGVRLADTIRRSLSIKVKQRFFWTDSKDVLCWLNSDHRRYSQFVAFRVSEILEASDVREWHWIPSKQNVADEGTKWSKNINLSAAARWFVGPEFLWTSVEFWPLHKLRINSTTEELRPHLLVHTEGNTCVIDVHRFSDWQKLLRCTAYVLRYVRNLKLFVGNNDRTFGPLQHWELNKAENYLHREAQRTVFADEIAILSRDRETENPDKCLPRSSSLFRQCTFLDEAYVIRIRGRTQACAFITRDAAQPIVLPRDHPITTLILLDFHKRFNHQNHQTTINEVRQRYHIPKLKVAYKNARKGCQKCKNDQASAQPPIMSALPMQRLAAYTHSCLLAIRNIIARRGTPAVIFSDRGTKFQGASKELKAVLQNINQDQLVREFMTPNTEWTFIPPVSPHMGGAWERLIRTVKANLSKLQWGRLPTDEVLNNTLLEIENVVNSRPLTEIPMDNDESPVLTPNHFLLGSSNGLKPWVPYNDNPTVLRNSYKQSQIMANEFWRGWLRDYLPEITRRTKWFGKVKPIQVDDVVIIVDPNSPRKSWPLGRVIATRSAADGQVRSATVQTTRGIYERPAVKLAVLDVQECLSHHVPFSGRKFDPDLVFPVSLLLLALSGNVWDPLSKNRSPQSRQKYSTVFLLPTRVGAIPAPMATTAMEQICLSLAIPHCRASLIWSSGERLSHLGEVAVAEKQHHKRNRCRKNKRKLAFVDVKEIFIQTGSVCLRATTTSPSSTFPIVSSSR